MTAGTRPPDLTATLQARLKAMPRELLVTPRDLDRGFISAGMASRPIGSGEDDLRSARQLREAIFVLAQEVDRPPLDQSALDVVNAVAAMPLPAPALSTDGSVRLTSSPRSLLASIATEAIYLLGGRSGSRVRQCASSTCTILFVDRSRAGDRRWCSMAACGNKEKVAEFRRRKRGTHGEP